MVRRRREEEHENHERWLVSYADFITLLFAFFVVMYSLSSVNEGQYRVLSDSIVQAFRSLSINDSGQQLIVPPVIKPLPPASAELREATEARRKQTAAQMRRMADEIRRVMGTLAQNGQVTVSEGAFGISIEINAALLFAPGEAALGGSASEDLRAVAQVLAASVFTITIEGHTDNTPINTYRFPSNWELSAVRASTVVGDTGFADVPVDYWASAWIKELAIQGITSGCGNGNYCPKDPVTRDQMAVFLLKAKYGSGYTPPSVGSSTGFDDVTVDNWAVAWIERLASEGITSGCGNGNYCPDNPVTRAQMAVFLVRTFNLP